MTIFKVSSESFKNIDNLELFFTQKGITIDKKSEGFLFLELPYNRIDYLIPSVIKNTVLDLKYYNNVQDHKEFINFVQIGFKIYLENPSEDINLIKEFLNLLSLKYRLGKSTDLIIDINISKNICIVQVHNFYDLEYVNNLIYLKLCELKLYFDKIIYGNIEHSFLKNGNKSLVLSLDDIKTYFYKEISLIEVKEILEKNLFTVQEKKGYLKITPPFFRKDVISISDIISEISKNYNYNDYKPKNVLKYMDLNNILDNPIEGLKKVLLTLHFKEKILSPIGSDKDYSNDSKNEGKLIKNAISTKRNLLVSSYEQILINYLYSLQHLKKPIKFFIVEEVVNSDLKNVLNLSFIIYDNRVYKNDVLRIIKTLKLNAELLKSLKVYKKNSVYEIYTGFERIGHFTIKYTKNIKRIKFKKSLELCYCEIKLPIR